MFRTRIILTISLLVLCVGLAARAGGPPNYALNGTATQSTEAWGGVPGNAINGNLGDFTHTASDDPDRWWELDLGEDLEVKEIIVYNRASCCGERLNNAVVKALDADRNEIYVSDPIAGAVTADVHVFDNAGAGFSAVRYIRLEGGTDFLSVGEVEVIGYYPFAYDPVPADGAVEVTDNTLTWIAGDGAASNRVYVGTDPAALELVQESEATEYTPDTPFVEGTTYYWRIDSVDAGGEVSEGELWSFTTLPWEAHFPSPADGLGNVLLEGVTLTWTLGKDAILHNVYFGTDQAAVAARDASTLFRPTWLRDTVDLDPLDAETTYYWAVDEWAASAITYPGPVWSFTTIPADVPAAIDDPSLVGYWAFDEGVHLTALDSSGNNYHGSITGATWVDLEEGSALDMDGVGYVDVPAEAWSTIENQMTIAFWAYGDPERMPQSHTTFAAYADPANNESRVASAHVPWGNGNVYFDAGGTATSGGGEYDRISKAAAPEEYEGQWRHWTFLKNAETGDQRIYLDGILWHSGTGLTRPLTGAEVTAFTIGCKASHAEIYPGMVDDFRLYNRALTPNEIRLLGGNPLLAWDPQPADGAVVDDGQIVALTWRPGDDAVQHHIYMGTDANLVAAGDPNLLLGITSEAGMAPTDPLIRSATYYWKVDEMTADGTFTPGRLWSFTVTDVNTESWQAVVAAAEPNFVATHVETGIYDIGALGGEITYEFVVRANPDEMEVSMGLIGRIGYGDTTAALKYEQYDNTGNYGATHFGVMDYDFGVANAPGEYTHLVYVSSEDAGTTALYVNGVYQASVDGPITLSGIVGIGYIPRDEQGSAFIDPFDGIIFGVAIYNAALSEAEIQAHSDAYFAPPLPDEEL